MPSVSELIVHPLAPICDISSRVLILGTMPSPKSREIMFYYGHPRNRFWSVLSRVFVDDTGEKSGERVSFLHRHHIALWDVLHSCEIKGASDSSIRKPVANNIRGLIDKTSVTSVCCTGKTAAKLYSELCEKETGIPALTLPSPSPANCAFSIDRLVKSYTILRRLTGEEK